MIPTLKQMFSTQEILLLRVLMHTHVTAAGDAPTGHAIDIARRLAERGFVQIGKEGIVQAYYADRTALAYWLQELEAPKGEAE